MSERAKFVNGQRVRWVTIDRRAQVVGTITWLGPLACSYVVRYVDAAGHTHQCQVDEFELEDREGDDQGVGA